jgi:long-chain fatty acid transport protein
MCPVMGPSEIRRVAAGTLLCCLVWFGAAAVRAEEPRSFEFSFSSPGARSMGLGGAFVPLSDDATAAFANPAGLVQLLRPEASIELRLRATVEDAADGQTTLGSGSGLSFFSVVYPLGPASLALYGHQLASFEFDSTKFSSSGASGGFPWATAEGSEVLDELGVSRLGLAAGWRLHERFSLGLGISYFQGKLKFVPQDGSGGSRSSESHDWGWNAGVLWSLSEQIRLGAFYRQGPDLGLGTPRTAAAGSGDEPRLELPDSYGLGLAYRTRGQALSVAFEWDRVLYSSLQPGMSTLAVHDPAVKVDDADELHLGAEYAFLEVNPVLAVRAGVWYDPDHRVCSSTSGTPYACPSGSDNEIHGALGFGMAFKRFQLDIGVDRSQSLVAFSISGIVSF